MQQPWLGGGILFSWDFVLVLNLNSPAELGLDSIERPANGFFGVPKLELGADGNEPA